MLRKSSLAFAVALALAPVAGFGAGLGQMRSSSALNEPFQGDIDLLSVGADDIQQLKVRLAPAEAFARAGVEMAGPLGKLQFKPYVRPNGQPAIRVTSQDPIREPFLNFLLELEWPQGKTVKEYTVLLDPPIFTQRRAAPVRAAEAALPPVDATPRERRPVRTARSTTASGERYAVRRGDTLWSIAQRIKPASVSTTEAVDTIYAANPDAFIRGDKNLVRAGAELRLPTAEELGALDVQTARREYLKQAPAPAAEAPAAVAPAGVAPPQEPSDRLRLLTAPTETAAAAPAGEGAPGTTAGGAEGEAPLRKDLLLAQEKAETALQTAEQLQGRVSDLENQVRDMQRLLLLKDQQLAEVQRGAATAMAEPAVTAPPKPATVEAPTEPAAPPAEGVAPPGPAAEAQPVAPPEPAPAEAEAKPEVAQVEARPTEPAVKPAEPEAEVKAVEPKPAEPAAEEKPAVAAPAPAPTAAPAPAPAVTAAEPEEPAGLAALAEDPSRILKEPVALLGISAAIVALLGAWLLRISRRRREPEPEPAGVGPVTEPVAPPPAPTKAAEPTPVAAAERPPRLEPAATGAAVAAASTAVAAATPTPALTAAPAAPEPERVSTEDLAALELSTTDLFGLKDETAEVDPTEEADVYIAYGRYEQAEQLLRLALEMEPGRLALQHKLLEVYFASRDASAYGALFSEIQAAGREGDDPAAWQRALRMGRQLDPNNPAYVGTAVDNQELEAALREAEAGLAAEFEGGDLDLDTLRVATPRAANPSEVDTTSILNDLSLDLGTEEVADKGSHPFKLDVTEEMERASEGSSLTGELDANDLAKAGAVQGFALDEVTAEQLEQEEYRAPDLSSIELSTETTATGQDTTLMHADTTLELVDDVETKLDLARAYIELGDQQGARSMLEEVLQEGNDVQKANAETMMKELG